MIDKNKLVQMVKDLRENHLKTYGDDVVDELMSFLNSAHCDNEDNDHFYSTHWSENGQEKSPNIKNFIMETSELSESIKENLSKVILVDQFIQKDEPEATHLSVLCEADIKKLYDKLEFRDFEWEVEDVVEILLWLASLPPLRNYWRRTFFLAAIEREKIGVVKLLSLGGFPKESDRFECDESYYEYEQPYHDKAKRGDSAAHFAVRSENEEIMQILLESDFNFDSKNRDGLSASDLAREGYPKMFALIENKKLSDGSSEGKDGKGSSLRGV